MWDGMDRRRFPRIQHPCKIKIKNKDSSEIISTVTENIGCGGICVILGKDLGLFSPAEVEVDLENGVGWIKCSGVVVWVVKREDAATKKTELFDTGIEFNNLKEEDHQRVEKMVNGILAKTED